jgi:hypothetical protein
VGKKGIVYIEKQCAHKYGNLSARKG